MAVTRRELITGAAAGAAGLAIGGVTGKLVADDGGSGGSNGGGGGDNGDIVAERGLTPDDVRHALATFAPPGRPEIDEFIVFSSGGHSGQVIVMGVPSMRILKVALGRSA